MPPLRAPFARNFTLMRPSFSRSYGGILPSSLTTVLPIALVFSTRPPASVWGTGTVPTHCWDFLGSMGSVTSSESTRHHVSGSWPTLIGPPYTLTPGQPSPGITYPPASPFSYPRPVGRFAPKSIPLVPGVGLDADTVVPEYQPVVHRLRLSASP